MNNIEQIESDYEWALTAKAGDVLPAATRTGFEIAEIDRTLGKGAMELVHSGGALVVRNCKAGRRGAKKAMAQHVVAARAAFDAATAAEDLAEAIACGLVAE